MSDIGVPESLVLTEDDYLDFLALAISRDPGLLPHPIQRALAGTSLLFVVTGWPTGTSASSTVGSSPPPRPVCGA